jgi:ethanolamine utilization protein EutP (predicted NTPase)
MVNPALAISYAAPTTMVQASEKSLQETQKTDYQSRFSVDVYGTYIRKRRKFSLIQPYKNILIIFITI